MTTETEMMEMAAAKTAQLSPCGLARMGLQQLRTTALTSVETRKLSREIKMAVTMAIEPKEMVVIKTV